MSALLLPDELYVEKVLPILVALSKIDSSLMVPTVPDEPLPLDDVRNRLAAGFHEVGILGQYRGVALKGRGVGGRPQGRRDLVHAPRRRKIHSRRCSHRPPQRSALSSQTRPRV